MSLGRGSCYELFELYRDVLVVKLTVRVTDVLTLNKDVLCKFILLSFSFFVLMMFLIYILFRGF